jgi:HTH-type transcriptional regulator/antitoxin HigA
MKATLIVIQNDADHAQAKALIEKLMYSKDPADQARMVAQAYLTEAYERSRWPRRAPSLPDLLTYLTDQHGLSLATHPHPGNSQPCKRGTDPGNAS